jgi:hypothetical protein
LHPLTNFGHDQRVTLDRSAGTSHVPSNATRELLLDAALHLLSDAELSDLLAYITEKQIAEAAAEMLTDQGRNDVRPPSTRTVGYQFRGSSGTRKFDRGILASALLARALERNGEIERAAAEAHLIAADALAEAAGDPNADLRPVITAIFAEMQGRSPGAADPLLEARERVRYAAFAACDRDGALAKTLRNHDEVNDGMFDAVYERYLRISGRRPASGYTLRNMRHLIAMFLEGETVRARYGGSLPPVLVADTVLRMFWALSAPVDGPELDYQAEALAAIRQASGS